MEKGLVSIVTPCYNVEKFIFRLMDSILSQDYDKIEMITVDDGSKDNSKAVIESYIPKFEKRGYSLKYIKQENTGAGGALRNGLQYVNGEFILWPDSDDFYTTNHTISKMVRILANTSDEYSMVRVQEAFVDEDTLEMKYIKGKNASEDSTEALFDDYVYNKNDFFYAPIGYMAKFGILKKETNLDYYVEKGAWQNYQMMAPLLYKYKCKTILEPLVSVLIRSNSASRSKLNTHKALERFGINERVQIETFKRLKKMPDEKKQEYIKGVRTKYDIHNFHVYARMIDKKKEAFLLFKKIKEAGKATWKEYVWLLLIKLNVAQYF